MATNEELAAAVQAGEREKLPNCGIRWSGSWRVRRRG